MGLKTYKYIKNTRCLPHFADGFVDPGNSFADKYAPATKAASGGNLSDFSIKQPK